MAHEKTLTKLEQAYARVASRRAGIVRDIESTEKWIEKHAEKSAPPIGDAYLRRLDMLRRQYEQTEAEALELEEVTAVRRAYDEETARTHCKP